MHLTVGLLYYQCKVTDKVLYQSLGIYTLEETEQKQESHVCVYIEKYFHQNMHGICMILHQKASEIIFLSKYYTIMNFDICDQEKPHHFGTI